MVTDVAVGDGVEITGGTTPKVYSVNKKYTVLACLVYLSLLYLVLLPH